MALSLREAAAQANTTKSTIWRAIKAGRLSADFSEAAGIGFPAQFIADSIRIGGRRTVAAVDRRAFSRPTRILGVLYRESFFAGEGVILEVEQDQSPYDTGHRAISPCLRFCLKTCCYESAAAIETAAFFVRNDKQRGKC